MKHLGTKELETKRLLLRKFVQADSKAAFHNWCNDDNVTKYLTWPTHKNIDITEMVISDWINSYEKEDFYQWAIVLKDTKEPIGSISIVKIDENVNMVEIGYCIGASWWNQGIVTEAFFRIISFLFEEMKVNKIAARHDSNNPSSGKVMEKCGLTYEGTLRQSDYNNQGICDVVCYGMLSSEYFERKHEM